MPAPMPGCRELELALRGGPGRVVAMSPVTTNRGIDNAILQADPATPLLVNLTPQCYSCLQCPCQALELVGGRSLRYRVRIEVQRQSAYVIFLAPSCFCKERKSAPSRNAGTRFAPNPTFRRRTAMPLTPMGSTPCRRLQGHIASHPAPRPGFAFAHRFQCRGLTRRPAPASASTAQSLAGPRRLLYVGAARVD